MTTTNQPAPAHAGEADHPLQIIVTGRKRSGKSEYSYMLWDSWDGDRVVIDTTKDFIGLHPEPDTIELEDPPPKHWPEHLRKDHQRMSLRYVPDMKSPEFHENCDRVAGMAFDHRDTLLVVEEVGVVAPISRPMPNMRSCLHHGGHQGLYIIVNGPRVLGIDPLWISQADEVVVFKMASPRDRKRIAENIAWEGDLTAASRALGDREHLRYVLGSTELLHCSPLPLKQRQTTAEKYVEESEGEDGPDDQ